MQAKLLSLILWSASCLGILGQIKVVAQSDELADCAQDLCVHDHYGPALTIEPFLNVQIVAGHNGLTDSGLEQGAHDPKENGFNLTGLSLGTDVLYNEYLAGYAEGIIMWV